jgi:hypothetical protein
MKDKPDGVSKIELHLQKEKDRIVSAVLRVPATQRRAVIRDEVSRCDPQIRRALEPLILLALESGATYHPHSEWNGVVRVGLALLCAIVAVYVITGMFTIEGKIFGLTIKGTGAIAVFVFVFLFYPPPIIKIGGGPKSSDPATTK